MSLFGDIAEAVFGTAGKDTGQAGRQAAEQAEQTAGQVGQTVGGAADEAAAQAAKEAAEAAARLAAEQAQAAKETFERSFGKAADWIEDHAGDIAWAVGKGAATIFAGPLGAAAVGGLEGGIKADEKGGDHFDILEGIGFGTATGGAGGNPFAKQTVDFAKEVDKKMDEGQSFWDAVGETAKDQPLDALRDGNFAGNSPVYEAGVHAGVAAMKGGDGGDIIAEGLGGLVDGAYGGTAFGGAAAGGVAGLAHGIADGKSDSDLWEAAGNGALDGAVHSSPGLGLIYDTAHDLDKGKDLDDRWEDIGKEAKEEAQHQVGLGLSQEPDASAPQADDSIYAPVITADELGRMGAAETGVPAYVADTGVAGTLVEMPSSEAFDDYSAGVTIYGGMTGSSDYVTGLH